MIRHVLHVTTMGAALALCVACSVSRPELAGVSVGDAVSIPGAVDEWRFYEGFPHDQPYGFPLEAHARLIAVRGSEWVVIGTAGELEPFVETTTTADALAFVRSFTTPDTHYLLRDVTYIEARCRPDRPQSPDDAGSLWDDGRSWGELREADCRSHGVQPPTVRRLAGSYEITRFVVDGRPDGAEADLYRVVEAVTFSGGYTLLSKELIAPDVDAIYPTYY